MYTLSDNQKTALVTAMLHLSELKDAAGDIRDAAKDDKALLSTFFMDVYHSDGAKPDHIDKLCDSLMMAARTKANNPELKQGDIGGAFTQYKSDVKKALTLTEDEPAKRKEHPNMHNLKQFITGNSEGPAATVAKLKALISTTRDTYKGADNKKAREVAMAKLDVIYRAALTKAEAEIFGESKAEDAPIIEKAEAPNIKVTKAAAEAFKAADLTPTDGQLAAVAKDNGTVGKAEATALIKMVMEAQAAA